MADKKKIIDASAVERLSPERLARLLDVAPGSAWTPADAVQALRHQLAAPLLPDLAAPPEARSDQLPTWLGRVPKIGTFLELFTLKQSAENSPAGAAAAAEARGQLLESAKRWARHTRADPATPLFEAPATVLYYAALAAARVHLGRGITSLSHDQCREGFSWAAKQPGAKTLTALFKQAIRRLPAG